MFDSPPSVELLTTLSRGSLRQDLSRAVRLWVILHSIYGEIELEVDRQFTYNEWRDRFFTQSLVQHKRDAVPDLHDPKCRCAISLKAWLFDSEMGANSGAWCQAFTQLYQVAPSELNQLLETGFSGKLEGATNGAGRKPLPQGRLFAVTGKQLQIDFVDLAKSNWLLSIAGKPNTYQKMAQLPNLIQSPAEIDVREFVGNAISTDAIDLFEHLGQPIRGVQRLFLDLEYIVPIRLSEQVANFQKQLKQLWEQEPVQPICITYRSARLYGEVKEYVVYPVCVHYFQRAPYLYAYGENPCSITQPNWYDFRLDRLETLQILEWANQKVSAALRDRCLRGLPPNPDDIQQKLTDAWGFDIHCPSEMLLLRFNQYFHAHYVANTERETLLASVNSKAAARLIQSAQITVQQQESLLAVIRHQPKDIYCRVNHRLSDRNVLMRLRAWGANVEVLLPWSLRLQMAKEMQETWKLYKSALKED